MASTGNLVKLVIQDMDIESEINCRYDYIQIQNAVIYGCLLYTSDAADE